MKILATITLILLGSATFAQALSAEIESIYTFKPSKLTDKEQKTKLPALDKFWNEVKADTSKYLPQLRLELTHGSHNPFFIMMEVHYCYLFQKADQIKNSL